MLGDRDGAQVSITFAVLLFFEFVFYIVDFAYLRWSLILLCKATPVIDVFVSMSLHRCFWFAAFVSSRLYNCICIAVSAELPLYRCLVSLR